MREGRPGGLFKTHLEAIVTSVAFVALHRAGLLGSTSLGVLIGSVVVGAAIRQISERRLTGTGPGRLHARLALGTLTTGWVMYATGWGPVLSIGFVFMAAQNIKRNGSAAALGSALWTTVGMGLGHLAIVTGFAPSLIAQPLVHSLAVLGWLGTVFIIRLVATSARESEQADREAAAAYQREHRTAEQLRRINTCLVAISSSMDLRQMLDAIAISTKDAFGAVFAAVLFADDNALLTGALTPGIERPDMSDLSKQARQSGPSATALATGEMVLVEDFDDPEESSFSRWSDAVKSLGVRSMAVVPLVEEGVPIAVLNVYFAEPTRLAQDEKDLLKAFAEEATVAVARARAFEQEKAARLKLEELDELKDGFISTVSHELRTPLTAIAGFSETLVERWPVMDDDMRLSLLDRIFRNANDMQALVEQLLDLSRLNKGHMVIDPQPVALRAHVDQILSRLASTSSPRMFFVEIPEDLEVQADPDGLNRILMNLITNAVKYSQPPEPVEIVGMRDGLDVVIKVIDHGPGIPVEEQQLIFEPFFQGSGRRSGKNGTGIGLDIARRFVDLHGGRIWVESTPGEGACFVFTLPHVYSTRKPPSRKNAGDLTLG